MSFEKLKKDYERLQTLVDATYFDVEKYLHEKADSIQSFSDDLAKKLRSVSDIYEARELFRTDLYLMLACLCNRKDMYQKGCLDRAREVQAAPDGYIDLWARDHYKSTIITFGLTIFDILRSHGDEAHTAEKTIAIFSFTAPIAKAFLEQIKREFETNEPLKFLYSDIFWSNPSQEAQKWSVDRGIIVKRQGNPKEATIEAWGVVEGQPTSKHFDVCVYDDMLSPDQALTRYSMFKATRAWEMSLNLTNRNGVVRYVGTRQHLDDTYSTIIDRQAATPRIYNPFLNQKDGEGWLKTPGELRKIRREQGSITWASQYLQKPLSESALTLNIDLLVTHKITNFSKMNIYTVGDPSSGKKKTQGRNKNDFTAILTVGIDASANVILIDGIRDRLNPSQRYEAVREQKMKYRPKRIFYEDTGLCADIFHFKEYMNEEGNYFANIIEPLTPVGAKETRIMKLEPFFAASRILIPESLPRYTVTKQWYDLVAILKNEEIAKFPFAPHDDLLDCLAYVVILLEKGRIHVPSTANDIDLSSFYEAQEAYLK